MAWCVLCACIALPVQAGGCTGEQRIRLMQPVQLSARERAEFRAMPPLRVLSSDAPPMTRHDGLTGQYVGIGVDVLCFIAGRLGLRYEILPGQDLGTADKIRQVQDGTVDMFMPLSESTERAGQGIFTLPFYESHYAVIARRGWRPEIRGLADLASFRVGVLKGVAFEGILRGVVPPDRLVGIDASGKTLFEALRDGRIDLAVFNKRVFDEQRYLNEYFDLEVVHTLHDAPRSYGFYFHPSQRNQRIVQAMNRHLAVMDVSGAVRAHEEGERQLIERYMAQRNRHLFWQIAAAVAVVLILVLMLVLRRYRRMLQRLARSNEQILRQQQALEAANRELERLSQTDGLTGLANRRQFDHALLREHARQRRTGSPLSLLMIDLDHFKHVNDHYGHAVGDDYLRAVARVLQVSVARVTDLAARYGGEEFVCLLPDTSAADAFMLAERIRGGVAGLALPNAQAEGGQLTVSVGVATLDGGSSSAAQLLERADEQLYAAKRDGRDRVHAVVLRS